MDETACRDLAARFRDGDHDAFRRLVESLTRNLMAQAYRYVHDWETARDLTQDTWLKVHRHIGRFDAARSFVAWLRAIHRNTCLGHLQKASVRYETSRDADDLARLAAHDPQADPAADLERREFATRLGRAVLELSPSQRRVFTQVDLEQGDQDETARSLGMKPVTLRTTLHFARRRLAGLLRGTEDGT